MDNLLKIASSYGFNAVLIVLVLAASWILIKYVFTSGDKREEKFWKLIDEQNKTFAEYRASEESFKQEMKMGHQFQKAEHEQILRNMEHNHDILIKANEKHMEILQNIVTASSNLVKELATRLEHKGK